jgi:hypothetical protein
MEHRQWYPFAIFSMSIANALHAHFAENLIVSAIQYPGVTGVFCVMLYLLYRFCALAEFIGGVPGIELSTAIVFQP